jgi:hypothetical protein
VSDQADNVLVMGAEPDYQAALRAVMRAAGVYRGGLLNDGARAVREAGGVTPWVPIYQQLLVVLRAALGVNGEQYDRATDSAGVPDTDRFGWRPLLQGEGGAGEYGA